MNHFAAIPQSLPRSEGGLYWRLWEPTQRYGLYDNHNADPGRLNHELDLSIPK